MKYKVSYKTELYRNNSLIRPDGFSCITFKNQGNTIVTIDNSIELQPGESIYFNEKPYVVIDSNVVVNFGDIVGEETVKNNKLVVITSFYTEI